MSADHREFKFDQEWLDNLCSRRVSVDFVLIFERRDESAAQRLSRLLKAHEFTSKLVNTTAYRPSNLPKPLNAAGALLVLISGPLSQVTRLLVRNWLEDRPGHTVYAIMLESPPSTLPLIFKRRRQALRWFDQGPNKIPNQEILRLSRMVKGEKHWPSNQWVEDRDVLPVTENIRLSKMSDFAPRAAGGNTRMRRPHGGLKSKRLGLTPADVETRLRKALERKKVAVPADLIWDHVSFSVCSRAKVKRGEFVALDVFVHKPEQTESLLEFIGEVQRLERRLEEFSLRTEGPVQLLQGTALTVTVTVDEFAVSPATKLMTWTGQIGSATFVLTVPRNCPRGPKIGRVSVRASGLEIARIEFVVEVSKATDRTEAVLQSKHVYHRAAFASYASDDRDAVLARVQGIQKIQPTLNVFLDVMKLRSGDDWKTRLKEEIVKADIFYLFWCRHALGSEWVRRE